MSHRTVGGLSSRAGLNVKLRDMVEPCQIAMMVDEVKFAAGEW